MYKMASEDDDDDLEALKLAALASMKKKSDVKKVVNDDIEDPELIALREAALLTKKNNANQHLVDNNQFQNVPPPPPATYCTDQYGYPIYEQPVYSFSFPPPPPNYPPPMLYPPAPPMLPQHNQIHPDMLPHQSIPGPAFHIVDSHSNLPAHLHQMPITTQGSDVDGKGGSPFIQDTGRNSPFIQDTGRNSPFSQGRKVGNNLIVITQAGGDEAKGKEKGVSDADGKAQLLRPQDKWLGPSDGNNSTASPVRRPKTSDKFSRFDSSNSDDSESDSDDDDIITSKKTDSISGDDGNDSNKENGSDDNPSDLSSCESDNEKTHTDKTVSLSDIAEQKDHSKSNSNENHASGSEMRKERDISSRNDKQKYDGSSRLQNDSLRVDKKFNNNNKKDSIEKTNDLNSVTSSRDKLSDLSEKLRNRKTKQEKDLSEKLLNRKSKNEHDLSERLLNRRFRKEEDLSEKLLNRKDGKKDVQDLSEKLTSRKTKSSSDVNKDISTAEQLSKDSSLLGMEKVTVTNSDVPQTSSNNDSKLGITEEERLKLEARRQKFQHQKSLDLIQVKKTISLKSIKKRKRKKLKTNRSRSRSLPKQYRHPPRSPSLPRQYRDIQLPRSKSPHPPARERSRSLSLPRQYRTEIRERIDTRDRLDLKDRTEIRSRKEIHERTEHDRDDVRDSYKQKDRKGYDRSKTESLQSGHRNDEKQRSDRRGNRARLSNKMDVKRRLSGADKGKSRGAADTKKETDEESVMSNASVSDVESDNSEGRSWRTEANKNRVRRRSARNVQQIPNSLTVSRPFGDRQRSNYNHPSPDRFRDRRKRHDRFDRGRFEPKQRYDNFTINRAKRFQPIESDTENGDKRVSSSIVLPNKNTPLPTTDDAVDSDSSKRSASKRRTTLQTNISEVIAAKRRVVNTDIVRSKSRRVTADYDSEFDARNYMNNRAKVVDDDIEEKCENNNSDVSRDSMGVFVTLTADDNDDKDKTLSRTSVHNRLGGMLDRSEKPSKRSMLKQVLRNPEERTVKRVKSKSKDDGLYEDDLEIKIKQIKEKNAAILRRQEEIRKDKERFGYK